MNRQEIAERLREHLYDNDERCEVAGWLRDWVDDPAESREIDFELCGCEVTGNDPYHAHDCARHIADLIDPTCEMEDAGDVPDSIKDTLDTFFCSKCGSPIYNDMSPSYCPYCGARVVSEDE